MCDEVYDYMSREETVWCCEECCSIVRELIKSSQSPGMSGTHDKLESAISEMKALISKVNEFMVSQENTATSNQTSTSSTWAEVMEKSMPLGARKDVGNKKPVPQMKTIIREAMQENEREEAEREKRIQNIVIFRAKESNSQDPKEREQEDKNLVDQLLKEIQVDNEVTAQGITRLGKKEDGKTRPLRFKVGSVNEQIRVMENLKYLKDAPDSLKAIVVGHDLTQTQRSERRALLDEAEAKKVAGYRMVVRSAPGPRWDPKIVKIKVSPSQEGTHVRS